jgi:uncharacterized protein YlxW (UPF0749 family)
MNRRVMVVAVAIVVAGLTAATLYRLKSRELALEQARVAEAEAVLETQKEVAKRVEELQHQRADLQKKVDLIEHLKDAPPMQVYMEAAGAAGGIKALEIQGNRVEITVAEVKNLQQFTAAIEKKGFGVRVTPLAAPDASPKSVRASVEVTRPEKPATP